MNAKLKRRRSNRRIDDILVCKKAASRMRRVVREVLVRRSVRKTWEEMRSKQY